MLSNGTICPSGIEIDPLTKKCRFFMGDRWHIIGSVETKLYGAHMQILVPGLDNFVQAQESMEDGTPEWLQWGPRVN